MATLSDVFRRALLAASKASALPTKDDETQDLVQSALTDLRDTRSRVADLALFSQNETLEDIPTRDLIYLAVPSVIAEVLGLLKATERNERLGRLREADQSYKSFASNLELYSIIPDSEQELYAKAASIIPDAARRRDMKIKQFQKEKQIKARIETLQKRRRRSMNNLDFTSNNFDLILSLLPGPISTTNADPDAEEDTETEDVLRDGTLLYLRLSYAQAHAHMDSISQELELLRNAPPEFDQHSPPPAADGQANTWRLDTPRESAILDARGKPLQPFIILPSSSVDRARLQQQVFQAGHRLPTMTIDEYLEIEQQRGNIITGGGPQSAAQPTSKEQLAMDSEQDGTSFGEEKAEEGRLKDENWARFTDENPRGAGNMMNRG